MNSSAGHPLRVLESLCIHRLIQALWEGQALPQQVNYRPRFREASRYGVGVVILAALASVGCSAAFVGNRIGDAGRGSMDSALVDVCEARGAAERVPSNPLDSIRLAECLEARGRIEDALRVVARLEAQASDRDAVMRLASERIRSLIVKRVQVAGLPARLKFVDSNIPLPVISGSVGDRKGVFVWDSGMGVTVLDRSLCTELELTMFGKFSMKNAAGGEADGRFGILDQEFRLGSLEVAAPPIGCLDLEKVKEVDSRILGIIGSNIMNSVPYQMSANERWVDVGKPAPLDLRRMESTFSRSLPHVWADLDGQRVRFILDTGSVESTISRATLDAMGISGSSLGVTETRVVAGGKVSQSVEVVSISRFQSGEEERSDVQFKVDALDLLGVDFLGDRVLVVDRDANLIGLSTEVGVR